MKLNKVLFLSLVSIASLAACNTKTSSTASTEAPESSIPSSAPTSTSSVPSGPVAPENTDIVLPNKESETEIKGEAAFGNELLLNHRYISVSVGEEPSVSSNIRGLARALSPANNLEYKIKDTNIATVDAEGNVVGVAQGETVLEVSDKNHPELKQSVPVYVFSAVRQRTTKATVTALSAVDEKGLNEIVDHELYEKSVYKNGSLHMYKAWDQNFVCSKTEGYFRLYETDGDIKTDDGAISFKNYDWIFHNNEFFDTTVYHNVSGVKTRFPVSMTSYLGQARITPVLDILDNMFTSGREIFTNTMSNCKLESALDYQISKYSNVFPIYFGAVVDEEEIAAKDTALFGIKITFDDTATQEDESNYGIPYGTPTPTTYNIVFTIRDNKLLGYYNHGVTTYKIGDDEYKEVYDIDHYYERITEENRDKFIFVPDTEQQKAYSEVDNLFDLQKKERII